MKRIKAYATAGSSQISGHTSPKKGSLPAHLKNNQVLVNEALSAMVPEHLRYAHPSIIAQYNKKQKIHETSHQS